MDTKTFRAPNTQAALEMIQEELGPSALIVSVRHVPPGNAWEVWKQNEVEVVALPGSEPYEKMSSLEAKVAQSSSKDVQRLLDQLAERLAQASTRKGSVSPALQPETATKPGKSENKAKTITPAVFPVLSSRPKADPTQIKKVDDRPQPTRPVEPPQTGQEPSKITRAQSIKTQRPEVKPVFDTGLASAESSPADSLPPSLRLIYDQLKRQGVEKNLISKLLSTCALSLNRGGLGEPAKVRTHIRRQLEAPIRTVKAGSEQIICLVGSSGSGKTSMCAKLAATAKSQGKSVVWVCADTIHFGAIAQAHAYADSLDIPLCLVYTPAELAEVVKNETKADLILVDTAAANPCSKDEIIELGAYLTELPERSTYLLAPATAKESDLNEATAAFGPYLLKGMIITKLDETSFFGAVYNFAAHNRLPLAYFSTGRRVLEDLKPASAAGFVDLLMGKD